MKAKKRSKRNASKERTLQQVETAQGRAVRFAENVLEDSDLAEELEGLTVKEYADRKRIRLVTPIAKVKTNPMATKTRQQLIDERDALADENEKLNMKLDAILGIAATSTDDEDDDEEETDEEEDDEEEA